MTEHDKTSRLSIHPLAAALADDPASPRDTVQIVGYIGKSQRAQHSRVYLSLAFDEYIDVPAAAILHHADVPETELPHGGTRLWVDAGAQVVHETRQSMRTEARFLEGAIAAEYLQEGPAEPAPDAQAFGTAITQATICKANSCVAICNQPVTQATRCLRSCAAICPQVTQVTRCVLICLQTQVTRKHWLCGGIPQSLACPSRAMCPSLAGCPSIAGCPSVGWCGDPEIPIDIPIELERGGLGAAGPAALRRQPAAFGAGYAPGGYGGPSAYYGGAAYGPPYGPPYGWPYDPRSR
jgi:hypothetical protein